MSTIAIDLSQLVTAADKLEAAKAAALEQLDAVIAAQRRALITDLPGQDAIYLAKEAEARAWLAAVVPDLGDYPLLQAEVGITAPDVDALAALWLDMAGQWRVAAAQLEARRFAGRQAIDQATTLAAVHAAVTGLGVVGPAEG